MRKINWDNIDILTKSVVAYLVIMGFCTIFFMPENVLFSLIHKHLKDLLICTLLYMTIKDSVDIRRIISGLSLIAYFVSVFSIRLSYAISYGFDYKLYREAVNSPNVGSLANSIVFVLLLMIFTTNDNRR